MILFPQLISGKAKFPKKYGYVFPWEVMEDSLHLGRDAMNVHSLLTDMPF